MNLKPIYLTYIPLSLIFLHVPGNMIFRALPLGVLPSGLTLFLPPPLLPPSSLLSHHPLQYAWRVGERTRGPEGSGLSP